jgi:hypothetical protein
MHKTPTPSSLKRAQWLTDLTTALVEAEMLLMMLESDDGFAGEAAPLRLRVEAVRSELDLLNRVISGEGRIVSSTWPNPGTALAGNSVIPAP